MALNLTIFSASTVVSCVNNSISNTSPNIFYCVQSAPISDHTPTAKVYEYQIEVVNESEVGRDQDPFGCSAVVKVMRHNIISF